jgi:hypothetical protein
MKVLFPYLRIWGCILLALGCILLTIQRRVKEPYLHFSNMASFSLARPALGSSLNFKLSGKRSHLARAPVAAPPSRRAQVARAATDDLSSSEDEFALTADTIAWNATHMKALRQRIQKVGFLTRQAFC